MLIPLDAALHASREEPRDRDPSGRFGQFDIETRRLSFEGMPDAAGLTGRKKADNGQPRSPAARLVPGVRDEGR